jgi:hypothetical protein
MSKSKKPPRPAQPDTMTTQGKSAYLSKHAPPAVDAGARVRCPDCGQYLSVHGQHQPRNEQ